MRETRKVCHRHKVWTLSIHTLSSTQARRNEKNSGGATNYEILSATMVGRRRKCFISNRLKGLEKLNICRRQVM